MVVRSAVINSNSQNFEPMSEKQKSILIVDDDQRNIYALSEVLKAHNFTVVSAESMQEAFEKLKNGHTISIILLDMMMPEMDGYEGIRLLKKDASLRDLPVFALTAQAMTGDREKCLDAGAREYFSKPVDVSLLLKKLNEYLK